MKVIDLLNKIANGEEVPRKIKWGEFELEWEELGYHDYRFLGTGNHLLFQGIATSVLNDEVEIIEEDPEDKEITEWSNFTISEMKKAKNLSEIKAYIEIIMRTQNEIIEKINKD